MTHAVKTPDTSTLGARILLDLKLAGKPLTARQIWESLGKPGAESSVGCRLATLRLQGYVYRVRQGSGDICEPSLWKSAP